jgi:hypothetical protein
MKRSILDARVVTACVVWGAHMERAADAFARRRTPGLIGPVFTTAPGISGSLRRLEAAGLVSRGVGHDQRTRPVGLTDAGRELVSAELEPWAAFHHERLGRLDSAERAELYRLLVKGSGLWDDVWSADPVGDD